ncbi:hypothetical protein MNBD_ALPHA06-291 [hydrothermal vent metagenome]|uniref:DUF2975 domain-containing protein n=1 Tax=hydrothermal vent metagenome TaxID=652676 RepID=A0A3B0S4F4_9ZZZZ
MRALGKNSVAAIFDMLLKFVSWILWAALALLFGFGIPALIIDGFHDLSWVAQAPPLALVLPFSVMFAVFVLATQFVISRLRKIFATLIAGDPFVPENAGRLRAIWMVLVGFELINMLFSSGTLLAQKSFGETFAGLQGEFQINWPLWLAVVVLVMLAEIFHEGAKLRREQKLTI